MAAVHIMAHFLSGLRYKTLIMTIEEATMMLAGKRFQVNGSYYDFKEGGQLTITDAATGSSADHAYSFYEKDGQCYLRTDPGLPAQGDMMLNLSLNLK